MSDCRFGVSPVTILILILSSDRVLSSFQVASFWEKQIFETILKRDVALIKKYCLFDLYLSIQFFLPLTVFNMSVTPSLCDSVNI